MSDDPEIFADNAEDGAMKALEEMEKRLKEVSDDRDRLLEALKPFAKLKPVSWSLKKDHYFIDTDDIRRARAAIEGVKEP